MKLKFKQWCFLSDSGSLLALVLHVMDPAATGGSCALGASWLPGSILILGFTSSSYDDDFREACAHKSKFGDALLDIFKINKDKSYRPTYVLCLSMIGSSQKIFTYLKGETNNLLVISIGSYVIVEILSMSLYKDGYFVMWCITFLVIAGYSLLCIVLSILSVYEDWFVAGFVLCFCWVSIADLGSAMKGPSTFRTVSILLVDSFLLIGFVYAANTSIHAAGLVCAGSIMFLLADLFLLVVTCFCCAQFDIADWLVSATSHLVSAGSLHSCWCNNVSAA
ncbi:hypothetical protein Tco_0569493 [Tanacetum coccineum]